MTKWNRFMCLCFLGVTAQAIGSDLSDYLSLRDQAYSWKVVKKEETALAKTYLIDLTSQTWRNKEEVNQPVWKHQLTMVVPHSVRSKKGLLYIGGGKTSDPMPEKPNFAWTALAVGSQSVVAELTNVPNQPLEYFRDGEERSEDNSVAFSWNQVLKTKDPTWNIRFPMVKSAVRAMDAIQEILEAEEDQNVSVEQFVVAGASKRGWTTLLTAAVDSRVCGLISIVMDAINIRKVLDHHYSSYGFWAPPMKDYLRYKIDKIMDSPEFDEILKNDDPYSYINQLQVPKFLIYATGDQFFLPEGSHFYFQDLKGPKFMRYIANADHYLKQTDVMQTAISFYSSLISDRKLPELTWTRNEDGSLDIYTKDVPNDVKLWKASSKTRDFRVETIGKDGFKSEELDIRENGKYHIEIKEPKEGYAAYFVEMSFYEGMFPLKLSTEVTILPKALPFHR